MATKKGGAKDAPKKEKKVKVKKVHEPGQRTNSKSIDVIEVGNGKVVSFGYPVRKTGTLVTSVLLDKSGNPIALASNLVMGVKVKSKKQHGFLQPGVAGEGKKGKKGKEEDED